MEATIPRKKRVVKTKKSLIDDPKEAEKRLEELLEKDGENPETREDFNRLLEAMARQNSREA